MDAGQIFGDSSSPVRHVFPRWPTWRRPLLAGRRRQLARRRNGHSAARSVSRPRAADRKQMIEAWRPVFDASRDHERSPRVAMPRSHSARRKRPQGQRSLGRPGRKALQQGATIAHLLPAAGRADEARDVEEGVEPWAGSVTSPNCGPRKPSCGVRILKWMGTRVVSLAPRRTPTTPTAMKGQRRIGRGRGGGRPRLASGQDA